MDTNIERFKMLALRTMVGDKLEDDVSNPMSFFNPGPAGPVSIRFHYACLCGGGRINPGSPGK